MKALEKDRTRRYQTANALAGDIRRHANHEPVSAGPPSAVYRTGKFVRRHRFGVAAAATLVLLLVAFGVTMAVQAQRIAQERDRANREAETAKRVSEFLVGLFEVSKPSEKIANSITAREILDRGAEQIQRELRDRPGTRAALLGAMGEVYQSLGLFAKARDLHEQALALRRKVFGSDSAEAATSVANLASVRSAQGALVEAEALVKEALATRRALYGNAHVDVAASLAQLGVITRRRTGDYGKAENLVREALDIYRQLLPGDDRRIARTLRSLSAVLFADGNIRGAEAAVREAYEINRRTLGPGHPESVRDGDNIAIMMQAQGKYSEAEAIFRENLAQALRSYGRSHPELNVIYGNLGANLFFQRRYVEAEAVYRDALAAARLVSTGDSPEVSTCLLNLGQGLDAEGKFAEAEELCRQAFEMDRRLLGPDHPDIAISETFLATTLLHLKRVGDAESLGRDARTLAARTLGPDHPRTKEAEGVVGAALAARGRWPEAEPFLLSYASALEKHTGAEGDLTQVTRQIVSMYESWGRPDKSAEWRAKLPKADSPQAVK